MNVLSSEEKPLMTLGNHNRQLSKRWLYVEIPSMDYMEAWKLQLAIVEAKRNDKRIQDIFLLLEHPPVFTLGRRGGRDHLMVSEDFLDEQGILVLHVERGGDITYHGPEQLVGYPIVDLRANGFKVVDFVSGLEEVMIRTATDWGIQAERNSLNRGVWVGPAKLGSIGIAVRGGISFHGFALNVNNSLGPFEWIHPCGLTGIQMTSMKKILDREIPMTLLRRTVKFHIQDVFRVGLRTGYLHDTQPLIIPEERSHPFTKEFAREI
jgi:lipoate-protein ligase B